MDPVSHSRRLHMLSSFSSFPILPPLPISTFPMSLTFPHLSTLPDRLGTAYPVQVDAYVPIGINGSGFSAQRYYFAEDAHGLIGE